MGTGVNGFGVNEYKQSNKQEQFTKGKTPKTIFGVDQIGESEQTNRGRYQNKVIKVCERKIKTKNEIAAGGNFSFMDLTIDPSIN